MGHRGDSNLGQHIHIAGLATPAAYSNSTLEVAPISDSSWTATTYMIANTESPLGPYIPSSSLYNSMGNEQLEGKEDSDPWLSLSRVGAAGAFIHHSGTLGTA